MKIHPSNLLLAAALLSATAFPAAAAISYTNDFSGTGANTAFAVETTDPEWALNSGTYRNTYTSTTITPTAASLPLTGVAGTNFVMQSQFTVSSTGTLNSNAATLGFGLLSGSTIFSGTNSATAYYLADFVHGRDNSTDVGRLRILAIGDTSGFTGNNIATNGLADGNLGNTNLAVTVGTTYTLRLTGTYSGGTLNMALALFDAAGTTQIGTSATASDTSPLTGTNFGYRNRIGLGGGTSTIAFDNFSVNSVPEPSSAILMSLAALSLAFSRRR